MLFFSSGLPKMASNSHHKIMQYAMLWNLRSAIAEMIRQPHFGLRSKRSRYGINTLRRRKTSSLQTAT
jgi:hypothetical protein